MKETLIPIEHNLKVGDYIAYNPETGRYRVLSEAIRQAEDDPTPTPKLPLVEPTIRVRRDDLRNDIMTIINGTEETFIASQIVHALYPGEADSRILSVLNARVHHALGKLASDNLIERITDGTRRVKWKFVRMPAIPF